MLKIEYGDIFQSKANVLVNPVNLEGVMGAGLAKEFKRRYPNTFDEYKRSCLVGELNRGRILFSRIMAGDAPIGTSEWILHFPTKHRWREPSSLRLIEWGLQQFRRDERSYTTTAFPALGCGLGGLDWETQVYPLMERYLSKAGIDATVYLYKTKGE